MIMNDSSGRPRIGCSNHYFPGGIETEADAKYLAQNVDVLVTQVNKIGGAGAPFAPTMAAEGLDLTIYGKSAPEATSPFCTFPENYFAHDANGKRIPIAAFGGVYLMQPDAQGFVTDSRGFQAHSLAEWRARDAIALNLSAGPEFKHAYYDSASIPGTNAVNPATGKRYTADEFHQLTWHMGDVFHSLTYPAPGGGTVTGGFAMANGLGNGPRYFASTHGLLDHFDLGVAEQWLRNPGEPADAFPTEADWQKEIEMVIDAEHRGRYIWTVTSLNNATAQGAGGAVAPFTPVEQQQWRMFTGCSHLLSKVLRAKMEFVVDESHKPYDEIANFPMLYDLDLGTPTETFNTALGYRRDNGIYRRAFMHGAVFINPTGTAITWKPAHYYRLYDGSLPGTYTLPPHSGVPMTRAA